MAQLKKILEIEKNLLYGIQRSKIAQVGKMSKHFAERENKCPLEFLLRAMGIGIAVMQ